MPSKLEQLKKEKQRLQKIEYRKNNKEKISLAGKLYYQKNKERINKRQRIYSSGGGNLRRYGISVVDYEKMLNSQRGVCAICKKKETSLFNGKVKKLSVDHCHNTNIVRGLLCNSCNRGLGYFIDSVDILKNALIYLKKYDKVTRVKE